MNSDSPARLRRRNFQYPAVTLARKLLGCHLCHRIGGEVLRGRIVEVEAYTDDLASHCAGGKRTPRNQPMFGPAGVAYIYFTYGMHHCFNVVADVDGKPAAVLLRGLDGIERAAGPALLCRALRLTLRDNGRDLEADPDLWIEPGRRIPGEAVVQTTRIGIRKAIDLPYRFYLRGSAGVSKRDRIAESSVASSKRPLTP